MKHELIIILFFLLIGVLSSDTWTDPVNAQLPKLIDTGITSHSQGQEVPVGNLTIFGTSTDDAFTTCEVYVDKNDQPPLQKVIAIGPGGQNDYSNWTFTYTSQYASITTGNTNELTAKLSCLSIPANLTAFYTVNVTGIIPGLEQSPMTNTTSRNVTANNGTSPLVLIPTLPTEMVNVENQEGSDDSGSGQEDRDQKDNDDNNSDRDNDNARDSDDENDQKKKPRSVEQGSDEEKEEESDGEDPESGDNETPAG